MDIEDFPVSRNIFLSYFHVICTLLFISVTGVSCDTAVVNDSLFTTGDTSLPGVELSATSITDVNGDGSLDLLLTGWDGQTEVSRLYLGDGQGGFRRGNADLPGVALGSTSVADVNQDGNQDVLLTGLSSSDAPISTLYLGNGDGTFEPANADLPGLALSSTSIGDVNGDGAPDLLLTGSDSTETPRSVLYLGDGQGGFTHANANLTGVEQSSTSIGDLSNDGNVDLLVTGFDDSGNPLTRLYLGDGNGNFTVSDVSFPDVGRGSTSIGDVNGDDTPDVFITGWNDSTEVSALYRGTGQTGFSRADAEILGVEKSSTAMGDISGNGILDLIVTGSNKSEKTSTVYLGQDGTNFRAAEVDLPGLALGSISLGDVNANDALDIILTGQADDSVPTTEVHLGYGDGTFTRSAANVTSTP